MRKAIIAAIVATALFAVGAFAAQFTVNAEDVASGRDSVVACADTVDVVFSDAVWNDVDKRYDVATATFMFSNSNGTATTCEDLPATWRIELPDTDATGEATIVGDQFVVDPTTDWAASDIEGAAVLIENVLLTSNGADVLTVDPFPTTTSGA